MDFFAVSSTNETEILLKVALNSITLTPSTAIDK
jgi:multisubunit Na+/H+ antiporter MnhE subunit